MEYFFAVNEPFFALFLIAVALWTIPWKGYALWKSARLGQKWWFVALLLINTLAILEILYIFIFSKRYRSETSIEDLRGSTSLEAAREATQQRKYEIQ